MKRTHMKGINLCPRCDLRPTKLKQRYCGPCQLRVSMHGGVSAPSITDDEIIEHYVFEALKIGCRECGENAEGLFAYEAGVQSEEGLKWYMMKAFCVPCNTNYEEIFEVRGKYEPSDECE